MSKENLTALLSSSETRSLMTSQNDSLKMDIATTAVANCFKKNHFSICDVDNICKVIGATPGGKAYDMLRALHCMYYADMPDSVRREIPNLMREVFGKPALGIEDVVVALKGIRA